ncbi:hypothetical protein VP01_1877g2 [Puccinia sorghi]|uniref:Uncharacterized protein n=1 Tax=Puccinia sorghi TaxID=27349 RepID=A0A0L6VEZ8_9BASI|nr:hypothetical protein VP01_1877g2 [Puccinia sorghi]
MVKEDLFQQTFVFVEYLLFLFYTYLLINFCLYYDCLALHSSKLTAGVFKGFLSAQEIKKDNASIILTKRGQRMGWRVGRAFVTNRGRDRPTFISLDGWTLVRITGGKYWGSLRLENELRKSSKRGKEAVFQDCSGAFGTNSWSCGFVAFPVGNILAAGIILVHSYFWHTRVCLLTCFLETKKMDFYIMCKTISSPKILCVTRFYEGKINPGDPPFQKTSSLFTNNHLGSIHEEIDGGIKYEKIHHYVKLIFSIIYWFLIVEYLQYFFKLTQIIFIIFFLECTLVEGCKPSRIWRHSLSGLALLVDNKKCSKCIKGVFLPGLFGISRNLIENFLHGVRIPAFYPLTFISSLKLPSNTNLTTIISSIKKFDKRDKGKKRRKERNMILGPTKPASIDNINGNGNWGIKGG